MASFAPLPDCTCLSLAWPTPNRRLREQPEAFFARTRANPDYGRPGWTRDCGKRFHKGCDIAPTVAELTGATTRVEFTDCSTGKDYLSEEPVRLPADPVFAVGDGIAEEVISDASLSTYGMHVVLRHQWPQSEGFFFTLYAHLSSIQVKEGTQVKRGEHLGVMGQTSSSRDACNWMKIAPHLHFEAWNEKKEPYDPVEFLLTHLV